ncbi:MAG: SAM-dependent chlorinase/fluorinase [Actinomycetota bacterium]
MRPLVAFLTDYGPGSEHVGAVHAAVAASCPQADRLDLAHDIPPGDVRWGALVLARLAAAVPAATVVAVVDPGVGTERRGLAVVTAAGGHLVGPDNGLLGPAARALGATRAVEIDVARLPGPVAATFHGRDVFAPVAARLAAGAHPGDLGADVDPAGIAQPSLPAPVTGPGRIEALSVGCDRFGNLALHGGAGDLRAARLAPGDPAWVHAAGHRHRARVGRVFADVPRGGMLVHVDSAGMIAIAVNGGSAVERLGIRPGEAVGITAMEG